MELNVKYLSDISKLENFLLKLENFMLFIIGISIVGLLIIFVHAIFQPLPWSNRASVFGVSFFVAIATFFSGLLVGFIFAVPRTTKMQTIETGDNLSSKPLETSIKDNNLYGDNSNLELISDWLATGIVAITLTNLNQIPGALQQFSQYIGSILNGSTAVGILVSLVLVSYSIAGFLIGYLGTRRRAAVDFGKGLFEEEEIKNDIKIINDQKEEEQKNKAREDVFYKSS